MAFDVKNRTFNVKILDYFLYLFIFGGNTLIAGSIVHALEFSMENVIIFFIGLILTVYATYVHEKIFEGDSKGKKFDIKSYMITLTIAVSSGCIAGGILHWEEGPKFGFYIVVAGMIISIVTTLLYNMKPIKQIIPVFFIKVGMFAGMSFVSGTIVHSVNIWFTNKYLILVGIALTIGCSLLNEALYKKRTLNYFLKEAVLLLFLTIGIGCITGGILHFSVNVKYALTLIISGTVLSISAAMFKNDETLVSVRK